MGWQDGEFSLSRVIETTMLGIVVLGAAGFAALHFDSHPVTTQPSPNVIYGIGLVRPRGGAGLTCTAFAANGATRACTRWSFVGARQRVVAPAKMPACPIVAVDQGTGRWTCRPLPAAG